MTPEHKQALLDGRKSAVKKPAQDGNGEFYRNAVLPEIEQRLAEVSRHTPKYSGIIRKAYFGKSLRAGINAKCLDCCCWNRVEVEKCTSYACPLWQYRPYQKETP